MRDSELLPCFFILSLLAAFTFPSGAQAAGSTSDLIGGIANESNRPDGVFGPTTYGLKAEHSLSNGVGFEGEYVRLHEPATKATSSFLDAAQLTIKSPEFSLSGQPLLLEATLWKNRLIDMYTNLIGLQATRAGSVSVSGAVYLGTATREEIDDSFFGGQLGVAHSFGPVEVAMNYMIGRIETKTPGSERGSYHKGALKAGIDLTPSRSIPTNLTLSIEDRFFDFGADGTKSDPADRFILVTGLEFHFGKLLFGEDSR